MPMPLIDPPWNIVIRGGDDESSEEVKKKSKSEKTYLIVFYYSDGTDDSEVIFVKGQANAREKIINRISEINIYDSFVLVEDVPFGAKDGKPSIYEFLSWIKDNYSDGFDVEDYSLHRKKEEEEFERLQEMMGSGDATPTYQNQQMQDTLFNEQAQSKELW